MHNVVSSTVEKLLQLVPTNESDTEFPSLQSTVQRSQPRVHSLYQAISPPSHQPDRSSSGPAATGNSTLTGQRGNRRLQGPTHIPPAVDRNQQLKNLTGNEFGGGLRVTPQQRVQQNPYQQNHQSKAYGQTNLGKGTAPGNQRRAGGGTNTAGGHGDNVPLHGHGQQKPPQVQGGFYQLGGTAVNSMPALSAALSLTRTFITRRYSHLNSVVLLLLITCSNKHYIISINSRPSPILIPSSNLSPIPRFKLRLNIEHNSNNNNNNRLREWELEMECMDTLD